MPIVTRALTAIDGNPAALQKTLCNARLQISYLSMVRSEHEVPTKPRLKE
jgi:hypothetical protein